MSFLRKNKMNELSLKKELLETQKKLDDCTSGKINFQSEYNSNNSTDDNEEKRISTNRRKLIFQLSIGIVLLISILNLIGWLFDITFLISVKSDWTPMKPLTAICLLLSASCLGLLSSQKNSRLNIYIPKILAFTVTVVGFLMIIAYIYFYFANSVNYNSPFLKFFLTVRMAVLTAILFALTGIILLNIIFKETKSGKLAKTLIIMGLMFCYYIPVSNIIGFHSIFSILGLSTSFYASIAFCMLLLGILSINEDTWVIKIFSSNLAGSTMVRKILPAILIAPPIISLVIIKGFERGFIDYNALVAFVTVTYSLILVWLLWWAANSVNKIDEKKRLLNDSLRQSEERYRHLVEAANSIIVRWNTSGNLTFVNNFTLTFFGYTQDEMLGKNIMMIVPNKEKSGRDLSNLINNIIAEPEKYSQNENENIKKSGERVWISWANRAITDNNGKVTEILAVGNDITSVKKVEEALKVEHDKMKAIIENMAVGVIVFDREGHVTTFNKAALKIHDFNSEEEMLCAFEKYAENFELKQISGEVLPLEEWPVYRTFKGEYVREYKALLSNKISGSTKYINYNSIPLYEDQNKSLFVIVNMVDYTSTQKLTEAILDSELRYSSLFNNNTLGIMHARIITDSNGKPVDYINLQVNDAFTRQTGFSKEQVEGKRGKEIYPGLENMPVNIFEAFGNTALNDVDTNLELYFDGLNKWFSIYAYSPKKGEFAAMFNDITERKQSEKILEVERELFVGIIDNIPVMLTIYDPQIKNFRFNNNFKHILGWTEKDLIDGDIMPKIYPDPDYRKAVSEYLQSLQPGWKEWRMMTKNGSPIDSEWANIILSNNTRIGIGIDITERKKSEEKLRKNEQRLQGMFNNAAIGIVETDSEEKFIDVNKKMCDILGYSRDELIGKTVYEITSEDFKHLSKELNKKLHNNEINIIDYEKKYLKRNGSTMWVHITISAVHDAQGNYTNSVGTIEDITERKKYEEALLKSETILKQAGTMANLGAWEIEFIKDRDTNNNPLTWSEQIYRIFGYEPGSIQVTNELFFNHVHPDDRKIVSDAIETAIREKSSYNVEHRIIRADNIERIVAEHAEISFDESGNPLHIIGAVQDITERKHAEATVKESEEKFRSLFENITEGVILHEQVRDENNAVNYRVVDLNPAFEQFTGIGRQSAINKLATDIYNSRGLPPDISIFSQTATSRKPYRFETYFSEMKKHFIINVISPKKGLFATVYEDITEQKAIEHEILMKNEELTRFIYTVSHDLKSPLVTIKMFTTYLKMDIEKNDKATQDSDLKYIENAADKMSRLLDELLELSRIGRKEQLKTDVSLNDVAQNAIDLVAGRISEKKVKVNISAPTVILHGFTQRFIQLYQNLIDNAVKFMGKQKEPVIEIGAFVNEKNELILFVRDNGSGVDPRHQHKLFGLFEKLDPSSEGTGIGLALVKRIVEVHGGRIWFESEGQDKGTTFYFTLENARILQENQV